MGEGIEISLEKAVAVLCDSPSWVGEQVSFYPKPSKEVSRGPLRKL